MKFSLSISKQLIIGFGFLIASIVAVAIAGTHGISVLSQANQEIGRNSLPSIRYTSELRGNVIDVRVSVLNHIIYPDAAKMQAEEKALAAKTDLVARAVRSYQPFISLPGEVELFDKFQAEWAAYLAAVQPVLAHSREGRKDVALAENLTQVRPHIKAAAEAMDALITMNNQAGDAAVVQGEQSAQTIKLVMIGIGGAAVVLALGLTAFILHGISRGISSVVQPMQALASGDLSASVPHQGEATEIGRIADAVQVFKAGLIRARALEEETALARASAEEQRKAGMRQMADSFEQAVGGIVGMVSSSATELQATAQTMTATASETASQSTTVAAAAEEAAANVHTVAAAAEELGASVQEIGRQVSGSTDLAQRAMSEADQTATLVQELSGAVAKIGDVVGLISSIASQTNLLALNATIEAARAGEAGRGFAVVAAEVKELASQTARATEEISGQIGQIQGATGQAVSAISSITARIREINAVATTIAAAVEEQGAATQEIVRNVAQASTGTSEVTSNIAGVARASEDTGAAASQVLASASELSRQSEHLSAEVTRFLSTVRAA
ncbi:methyl-accepting chemotaxis protein [Methylobacterium durans]|uniref:Methyl-accepting chemotaxis protein n=1 Tax=Methylobacterium durans TaxID=2202825 RepID=A0A2U8W2F6_9HYPH|nr:MCP four helix bundle domain-containing protein [Methylobacterium durans]AWN40284.1 methyl-accepting chemotaxis protein [Methylobacterium durans]